uniref:Uncharacterized protein n=1 Tax=Rhizophora mucronata TaxID=61149 RepID=A0A2P2P3P7_RHIMU
MSAALEPEELPAQDANQISFLQIGQILSHLGMGKTYIKKAL